MAADAGNHSLPYDKKSDTEKDHLFKNIAAQLDKIATDVELAHSAQLKTGQLSSV